jgi:hypothetical protein
VTRSGIRRHTPRCGGQVVFGVDSGTLQVWDQHYRSCGVCEMKGRADAVTSTCAIRTVAQTLMSTSVDRVDRALGKTEQMERVGGSLLDVTVSGEGKIPGRGEDLFILLLHFFNPKMRGHCLLYAFFAGPSQGTNHGLFV